MGRWRARKTRVEMRRVRAELDAKGEERTEGATVPGLGGRCAAGGDGDVRRRELQGSQSGEGGPREQRATAGSVCALPPAPSP
jgi:hypothetical protein